MTYKRVRIRFTLVDEYAIGDEEEDCDYMTVEDAKEAFRQSVENYVNKSDEFSGIEVEDVRGMSQQHMIKEETRRVTVDGIPFDASVNFGGFIGGRFYKDHIWVQAHPAKIPRVKSLVREAIEAYARKGYERDCYDAVQMDFHAGCEKCDGPDGITAPKTLAQKFKAALGLPTAEISVYATLFLGAKYPKEMVTFRGREKVIKQYAYHQFCILHGSTVRYDYPDAD